MSVPAKDSQPLPPVRLVSAFTDAGDFAISLWENFTCRPRVGGSVSSVSLGHPKVGAPG